MEKVLKAIIWSGTAVIIFTPLLVGGRFFFPFIVPKTIVFYATVEIIFLAFLLLAAKDNKYRLRFNLPAILFSVYLVLIFISSWLGDNFFRSFWSNNERSEGLFMFWHLWLLLLVLTSFFRRFKDWLYLFDLFFASAFAVTVVALVQYFANKGVELINLNSWIFQSSGGQRLASTIGNAGYVAGFLIFAVFLGLWLFFKRSNIYIKIYYLLAVTLDVFVVFQTYTRGGILAVSLAGLALLIYLTFFYFENKKVRWTGAVLAGLFLILVIFIFANKQADFIQNNQILGRIASISVNSNTAQTRLMTWNSAWQGFKERPILGWGQENFYQVFDKYFNPQIYADAGAVVWFDRAHNIIFDRLITGGLLGLATYLSFIFVPLWFLWCHFWRQKVQEKLSGYRFFLLPVIFTLSILSYLMQNLFIFEALVIYVPLFLTLAFIGLFGPDYWGNFLNLRTFKLTVLGIFSILILWSFSLGVIKPAQANLLVVRAINSKDLSISQRLELFTRVLSNRGPGNQEYRTQLANMAMSLLASGNFDDQASLSKLVTFTQDELKKQLTENPHSVANYLLAMEFNNSVFIVSGQPSYLNDNLRLFEQARKLSPTRQAVYFELGNTYLYFYDYYFRDAKQKATAEQYYNLAVEQFNYAIELNRENPDSYLQLVNILVYSPENAGPKIWEVIQSVEDKNVSQYNKKDFLGKVISQVVAAKKYEVVEFLAGKLLEKEGDNPDYYNWLIQAQAFAGKNSQAIESAKKLMQISGYQGVAQNLIDSINAGEFKNVTD